MLFSGTIRDNLDPFNEYRDQDLISVIRRINLAHKFIEGGQGLQTEITESYVWPSPLFFPALLTFVFFAL